MWGKRRFGDGRDDRSGSLNTSSQTIRGFTGEEFLGDVGLVHLNGRVYDPLIARMLSADPVVGDPMNGQTWNRYSYVYNQPLNLTDPTGYCPWSACIGYAVPPRVQGATLRLFTDVLRTAVVALCVGTIPGCQPLAPVFAAVTSSFSTVINGGDLKHALVSGAISGATAVAFKVVGDVTQSLIPADPVTGKPGQLEFGTGAHLFNIAGHALVGCGSAAASGGKCGAGALSGGVTAFAGPVINKLDFAPALVANATIGGFASVAGGGKFANGAVTGAFGYLFNKMAHCVPGDPACGQLDLGAGAAPMDAAGGGSSLGLMDFLSALRGFLWIGRYANQKIGPDSSEPVDVPGTDQQWGDKFGGHGDQFGFPKGKEEGKIGVEMYKDLARAVRNNPNATVTKFPEGGPYAGETHYQVGDTLLRIDRDGMFRSLYKP